MSKSRKLVQAALRAVVSIPEAKAVSPEQVDYVLGQIGVYLVMLNGELGPTLPVQCPHCAEQVPVPLDELEFLHSGVTVNCPECGGEVVFDVSAPDERAELYRAQERVRELEHDVEFWMGTPDGSVPSWPPEEAEWRELADILPIYRTAEQTAWLRELARAIREKSDARMNWARAERAQGKVEVLAAKVAALEIEIKTLERALGKGRRK